MNAEGIVKELEVLLTPLGLLNRISAVEFFALVMKVEALLSGTGRRPGEITLEELGGMLEQVRELSAGRGARQGD